METQSETSTLIAADKVSGTPVYNAAGESLGEIYDVMVDKVSGKIAYAVMSFGGFLGIGEQYHPIPWSLLKYDTRQGGYIVNLDKQQLEGAPVYSEDAEPRWGDRIYDEKVYNYYNASPYWGAMT
jgi:sporulation protein YlmC with PRC-barrel domain